MSNLTMIRRAITILYKFTRPSSLPINQKTNPGATMSDSENETKKTEERRREQLKLEFAARIEEYKVASAALTKQLEFSQQTLTVTFTLAGALLAGASFITQQKPILFVVASWLFLALLLSQMRYAFTVIGIGSHIIQKIECVIPQVIQEMAPGMKPDLEVLPSFEHEARRIAYVPTKLLLPIEASRYAIPLLGSIVSFCAYVTTVHISVTVSVFIKMSKPFGIEVSHDGWLLLIQIAAWLYVIALLFKIRGLATQRPYKEQ